MSGAKPSSYFALFLVFASGVGFSVQSLCIKVLEEGGFRNPIQILFLRGLFQSFVSFLISLRFSESRKDSNKSGISFLVLFIGAFLSFGGTACIFLTTEYVSVGIAMILDRQSIIFGSIFACIFLGEPWLIRELLATMLSMCGIIMIADPDLVPYVLRGFRGDLSNTHDNEIHAIGFLYGFMAALFAAGSYTAVRAMGTVSPVRWDIVTLVQGLFQISLSLPLMWLLGTSFVIQLTISQWGTLVAAVVVGTFSQYAQTLGTFTIVFDFA